MGRINVTFPIFADSNVQPSDVAAEEYGAWFVSICKCACRHGGMPKRDRWRLDQVRMRLKTPLASSVAAHGHIEPSHYGELVAPGESRVATSCKLTWLVLG